MKAEAVPIERGTETLEADRHRTVGAEVGGLHCVSASA